MISEEGILAQQEHIAQLEELLSSALSAVEKQAVQAAIKQFKYTQSHNYHLIRLLNNLHDAVIEINADGQITFWNKQAENLFGYQTKKALNKNFIDLIVHPDFRQHVFTIHKNTFGGDIFQGELTFERENEIAFLGYLTDTPIITNDGSYAGSVLSIKDITQERSRKESLVQLQEIQHLQLEASLSFANMMPSNCLRTIRDSIEMMGEFFEFSRIDVFSKEPFFDDHWIANYGEDKFDLIQALRQEQFHWIEKQFSQHTYLSFNKDSYPDLPEKLFPNKEVLNCISHVFPLINQGKYLGFISLCPGEHLKVTASQIDTIQLIAYNVAGAIRLYIEDKIRGEQEELFRTLAQNTSDGLAIQKAGKFTYLSPSFLSILGYSEDELRKATSNDLYNLIHSEDQSSTKQIIRQAVTNQKKEAFYQYRVKHKDGHYIWREDHTRFVYDSNGKLESSFIVARDITERIEIDLKLHQKERQAQALIEGIPDLIFRLDKDGNYLYHKAKQEELIVQGDIIGKNFKDLLPFPTAKKMQIAISDLFKTGEVQIMRYELELPSLGHKHYEARLILSGDEEITALVRDITKDIKSQEDILTLHTAIEQSPLSVIITDLEHKITYANTHFFTSSGYTKQEVMDTNQPVFKSKNITDSAYNSIVSKITDGESWNGEVLSVSKKGKEYWESVHVTPLKDDAYQVTRFLIVKENISKLKELNKELRDLSFVAAKTSDAILITDKNQKIEWVNNAFTELYGYTIDEVRGKIITSFLHGPRTNPSDIEALINGFSREKAFSKVILNYTKDNEPYWIDCNITPVFDKSHQLEKFLIVERDISELVDAQTRIRSERNLLGTLIDHLPSLVFLKDIRSKRTLVNQADVDFHGKTHADELIGKSDYDLYPESIAKTFVQQDLEIITSGKPLINQEVEVDHSEGKRWLLLSRIPLRKQDGSIEGLIGIGKDVTELKLREIELQDSIAVIGDQNKRLKEFTYIVSHNIRSHAANIHSLIKLVEVSSTEAERQQYLEMLDNVSSNQLSTLDNLNDIISIQGSTNINLEPLHVRDIVSATLEVLKPEILRADSKIKLSISENDRFYANRAYFESIVLNLCSNAIKYRHPSRENQCEVVWQPEADSFTLEVKDNGLGFDVERYKDRLFGMNQTFHNHPNARGIGLFLVKNQVEALGGKISVTSKPDVGSTFKVVLPNLKR